MVGIADFKRARNLFDRLKPREQEYFTELILSKSGHMETDLRRLECDITTNRFDHYDTLKGLLKLMYPFTEEECEKVLKA